MNWLYWMNHPITDPIAQLLILARVYQHGNIHPGINQDTAELLFSMVARHRGYLAQDIALVARVVWT